MLKNDEKNSILIAHLKEAKRLFENNDYNLTIIYSNRLISDALIMDDIEGGIVGFVIRVLALSYTNFKNFNPEISDSKYLSEVRVPGTEFLAALDRRSIGSGESIRTIWDQFVVFMNDFRRYQHSKSESMDYYTGNSSEDYSNLVAEWMMHFLDISKSDLLLTNNNLLKGISNEIERISILTGYNVRNTLLMSCLMSMDWYLDFVKELAISDPVAYKNKINEEFIPSIDELSKLLNGSEISVDGVTNMIWSFLKNWRKLFIVFMELTPKPTLKDSKVVLPLEFKNKLTDALSKSVRREMGIK